MVDLKWNEAYSLGNNKIDIEHKKLFQIAAKAFQVVNPDKKVDKIREVLKELLAYTKTHFEHEEKFMKNIGYPELDIQIDAHKKIIASMKDFSRNLSKMSISEIEKELAHFIEVWFLNHIIYVDKKISQWQLKNKIPDFTFAWKSSYSIGDANIDAEHQELFKIASEAFVNVPQDKKLQKIKDTLNNLFEYFKEHFKDEEEYMLSLKYDKLQNHKDIHEKIIDDLNTFIKKTPSMKIEDIEEELKDFIEISLVNHIIEEDMKISAWTRFLKDLSESKKLQEQ